MNRQTREDSVLDMFGGNQFTPEIFSLEAHSEN
jgi:hypothetical protein